MFRSVADVAELNPELPLPVEVAGVRIAVISADGSYYAVQDECSHGAVPLSDGEVIDGTIECYLHGAAFDLRTGQPRCLPATEPVAVYPCRVIGAQLEVDIDNPITSQES